MLGVIEVSAAWRKSIAMQLEDFERARRLIVDGQLGDIDAIIERSASSRNAAPPGAAWRSTLLASASSPMPWAKSASRWRTNF